MYDKQSRNILYKIKARVRLFASRSGEGEKLGADEHDQSVYKQENVPYMCDVINTPPQKQEWQEHCAHL